MESRNKVSMLADNLYQVLFDRFIDLLLDKGYSEILKTPESRRVFYSLLYQIVFALSSQVIINYFMYNSHIVVSPHTTESLSYSITKNESTYIISANVSGQIINTFTPVLADGTLNLYGRYNTDVIFNATPDENGVLNKGTVTITTTINRTPPPNKPSRGGRKQTKKQHRTPKKHRKTRRSKLRI